MFNSVIGYIGQSLVNSVVSSPSGSSNTETLNLSQPNSYLKAAQSYAFVKGASASRFYGSGNSFHDNRDNGMLIKNENGIVTVNTISNTTGDGIRQEADGKIFLEGAGQSNVIVSDNIISSTALGLGSISCFVSNSDSYSIYAGNIRKLNITNNTINNASGPAIFSRLGREHADREQCHQ